MSKLKTPLTLFFITVIVIALLATFGPEEQSLGANVRIVYLHGAWVLTAEIAFFAAAVAGVIAFITRRDMRNASHASSDDGATPRLYGESVLRLMSQVIHTLWSRNDRSLLILPGLVPIDEPAVESELVRYLTNNWPVIIEK